MRKNKSVIALLLSLCVCICFFSFTAYADSGSSISIELDKTEAKVGEVIKATLKINNIEDFSGYQVNLRYNPAVLEAIDPATNKNFEQATNPSGNDILLNQSYAPLPIADNLPSDGLLNFGRSYLGITEYKNSGKAETSGTLAVINFKVIKEAATELIFEDLGTMPNSINGTLVFDWNAKQITSGYDVKISPKINPNAEPAPMPEYTMKTRASDPSEGTPEKDNTALIIVILAVVILVTITVLVFIFRGGKGTKGTDDKQWLDEDDSDEMEEYDDDDVKKDENTQGKEE